MPEYGKRVGIIKGSDSWTLKQDLVNLALAEMLRTCEKEGLDIHTVDARIVFHIASLIEDRRYVGYYIDSDRGGSHE